MTARELPRLLRGLLLLGVAGAGSAGVTRLVAPPAARLAQALGPHAPGDVSLVVVLTGCCAGALALCWGWLVLCTAVVTAGALRGDRTGRAARTGRLPLGAPRWVGAVVLVAVGAGAGAGPAVADAPGPGLDGLALPDRTTTSRPWGLVHVHAGDTLWSLARRALPPRAGDAAVDRAWRRLAAANRDRVADPDLIFPGTALRVPRLDSSHRKEPS